MENTIKFKVTTNLISGIGSSKEVMGLMESNNYKNVFVFASGNLVKGSKYYESFVSDLRQRVDKVHVEVKTGEGEPDYDYLDELAGKIRSMDKIDVIIGVGGGSTLDIAKALAVLRTNPGKAIDYRGFDKVLLPGVPSILIPATAGTGSEATINAVFIDKQEKKKLGINGNHMSATYAVLDAEWVKSCSYSVLLSSGMDALTHTLESFMCRNANVVTRSFSKNAFRLIAENLPKIKDELVESETLQNLLLGSYFAGIALYNAGSGISGALSYPLGVHYKIPHGIGGGIFLADVIKYNVEHGYYDYAELVDCSCLYQMGLSEKEKSEYLVTWLADLAQKLGVPKKLTQWKVSKSDLPVIKEMLLTLQAAFNQNPIEFMAEVDAVVMVDQHLE